MELSKNIIYIVPIYNYAIDLIIHYLSNTFHCLVFFVCLILFFYYVINKTWYILYIERIYSSKNDFSNSLKEITLFRNKRDLSVTSIYTILSVYLCACENFSIVWTINI